MNFYKIKKKITSLYSEQTPLVRVYSHPRSGTHFLEAFLAKNFYNKKNLKIEKVIWGHWSNRKINEAGNKYGKLFGNHNFPDKNENILPKIYIFRDGRAVAYSVWKTDNFLNRKLRGLSFNDFLISRIDWYGTPANKVQTRQTIFEHWAEHVSEWKKFSKDYNVLIVKYEDLVEAPEKEYYKIHNFFYNKKRAKSIGKIKLIKRPVGLLPNAAQTDAWRGKISNQNLERFQVLLKQNNINHYK